MTFYDSLLLMERRTTKADFSSMFCKIHFLFFLLHVSASNFHELPAEDMASMMAAMAHKMGPVPPRPFVGKGGKAPLGKGD